MVGPVSLSGLPPGLCVLTPERKAGELSARWELGPGLVVWLSFITVGRAPPSLRDDPSAEPARKAPHMLTQIPVGQSSPQPAAVPKPSWLPGATLSALGLVSTYRRKCCYLPILQMGTPGTDR